MFSPQALAMFDQLHSLLQPRKDECQIPKQPRRAAEGLTHRVFHCELKTTVLNWFSILPSNPARIWGQLHASPSPNTYFKPSTISTHLILHSSYLNFKNSSLTCAKLSLPVLNHRSTTYLFLPGIYHSSTFTFICIIIIEFIITIIDDIWIVKLLIKLIVTLLLHLRGWILHLCRHAHGWLPKLRQSRDLFFVQSCVARSNTVPDTYYVLSQYSLISFLTSRNL